MKKKCHLIHSISRSSQVVSHTINVGFFALFSVVQNFSFNKIVTFWAYIRTNYLHDVLTISTLQWSKFDLQRKCLQFFRVFCYFFFSRNKSLRSFLQFFTQFLAVIFSISCNSSQFLTILNTFSRNKRSLSKSIFQIITQLNCNFYLTVSIIHNSIYYANFSIIPPRFHWYYVF